MEVSEIVEPYVTQTSRTYQFLKVAGQGGWIERITKSARKDEPMVAVRISQLRIQQDLTAS